MNVEISGIPLLKNEDCKKIVADIGFAMGLSKISIKDIDVAHRLFQNKEDHTLSIIARFYSRTDRDHFFYARSELKSIKIQDLGYDPTIQTNKMKNLY